MQSATAYLGTSLFCVLIVWFIYRSYKDKTSRPPQMANVPLWVDRQALLDHKRQAVAERRRRLVKVDELTCNTQVPESPATQLTEEVGSDGFGEDLGAALQMTLKPDKPKRPSRFKALEDVASELKEVYKQNNTI